MSNALGLNNSNGVSVSVHSAYGIWGPYAKKNSSSKDIHVQVVERGSHGNPLYKNLDEEFLAGIDIHGKMRFICDIPPPAIASLRSYRMAQANNNESEMARFEGLLDDFFDQAVKLFG